MCQNSQIEEIIGKKLEIISVLICGNYTILFPVEIFNFNLGIVKATDTSSATALPTSSNITAGNIKFKMNDNEILIALYNMMKYH